ncbi:MAG: hypothetical protein JWR51_936 [Devosia sp.]|uniref:FliO/MopB family protein n=1 Tax=Devosia sp. TaxID=1871048 RepID=UPI00260BC7D0|nr:flagellar biosynthetic protein FliO [Devosia sp.]MDB5527833.1 hypothetical protein [Devosia sp.]
MQFITSLFGGEGSSLFTALFALGAVIVLIVLAVWLLKVVFNASGNMARGRNRRLSVVDSLALDPKRQLLIIRRDNVEHLILTGGPQDVVIEAGIAMAEAASQPSRRPMPVAPRRPMPIRPAVAGVPPVAAPTTVAEPSAAPARAIEKLRDPELRSPAKSLRHTGLMRPVPPVEPSVNLSENSDQLDHDSAKEVEGYSSTGITEFDEQDGDIRRDERKADGV